MSTVDTWPAVKASARGGRVISHPPIATTQRYAAL